MILFHNSLGVILPLVVHDSYHVLTDLDLTLVRLQVSLDGVVSANLMAMENLHSSR